MILKRLFLFVAVVIAAVAVNCFNHEKEEDMSDLAKANVKALAMDDKDNPTISGLLPISSC